MTSQAEVREVPSVDLKKIMPFELPALFRRAHLNRPFMLGLVGDIGSGKSVGGGLVALLDYMLAGDPCFANLDLKANFEISDEAAALYGVKGGTVTYESKILDKHKFLRFDPEYANGVFFTHEFNIWLADARRSTSNLNLETNDVAQELRKLNSAWIYDCVNEMFVDVRVRDATDIFIQTSDTAFTPTGMARKQKQGIEFEWWITAMTKKGAAIIDFEKGKPKGPIYIQGKQLWGIIDTNKKERREKYKTQIGRTDIGMEMAEDASIVAERAQWSWLDKKAIEVQKWCINKGVDAIRPQELFKQIGRTLTRQGKQRLAMLGIYYDTEIQSYKVNTFTLNSVEGETLVPA